MIRGMHISRCLVFSSFALLLAISGCTKRPSEEELSKLEEAKAAAESAERKLEELKQERIALEGQVQAKEEELRKNEAERDELKQKMGK